jgi:tetratricopeptide (TPR) repeat protein
MRIGRPYKAPIAELDCQRGLGQTREALATCDEARRHYPDNMEILFQESLVRHQLGNRKAAIATLERLLSSRALLPSPPPTFTVPHAES